MLAAGVLFVSLFVGFLGTFSDQSLDRFEMPKPVPAAPLPPATKAQIVSAVRASTRLKALVLARTAPVSSRLLRRSRRNCS